MVITYVNHKKITWRTPSFTWTLCLSLFASVDVVTPADIIARTDTIGATTANLALESTR
jgi:hypothetical protein